MYACVCDPNAELAPNVYGATCLWGPIRYASEGDLFANWKITSERIVFSYVQVSHSCLQRPGADDVCAIVLMSHSGPLTFWDCAVFRTPVIERDENLDSAWFIIRSTMVRGSQPMDAR